MTMSVNGKNIKIRKHFWGIFVSDYEVADRQEKCFNEAVQENSIIPVYVLQIFENYFRIVELLDYQLDNNVGEDELGLTKTWNSGRNWHAALGR